ncbi:MAG: VUT family protein [Candidatus Parabeggiatoa sp. nov. 2]|nr:MAG: hypothetical protein B6247_21535 [Beggiatoa sp. 4572_84]RKZ58962.1 MAG: VUT family protein [Gammaproteobacteria bacterium]
MLPFDVTNFFATHQDLLWLLTVAIDLSLTLLLYRLFGKMGLYTIVILNIMLSNLQGPKLTVIFGMETSLGVILYSGIYFATDLLSEKYGKREGQRAVLLGFAASVILVVMVYISLLFLPSDTPKNAEFATNIHQAMVTLFNFTPLFVFGSLFAYLITQSFDVWIFHYIREKTQGRHLWLRNNVSTISSQALDTLLYAGVVWGPIVGFWYAIELALAKYIIKIIIALIDTIFIYWARNWDMSDKDWNESLQGKSIKSQ